MLYKQKDDVALGSPLEPTMANVFYHFINWNGLNSALVTSNLFITGDMFMIFLFYSSHRNISGLNMSFSFEQEKKW